MEEAVSSLEAALSAAVSLDAAASEEAASAAALSAAVLSEAASLEAASLTPLTVVVRELLVLERLAMAASLLDQMTPEAARSAPLVEFSVSDRLFPTATAVALLASLMAMAGVLLTVTGMDL